LAGYEPVERGMARSIDAWFRYVETHPYAWRMLFADTSGDPDVAAVHREVAVQSRAALLPMLAQEEGTENIAGPDLEAMDMAWEVFRAVLQGLAQWWYEHRHVPRERVGAPATNALRLGFDRVSRREGVWGSRV